MGKLIGIWSPRNGTGRTTITLAIAYKIAELDKNKKILVCCANGANNTLIKTMGVSSEEIGLEDLVSFRLAGFVSYGYEAMLPRRGRIYIAGSSKMTPIFSQTYYKEITDILNDFRKKFDVILIDLPNGTDSILGNSILSECDNTVTVLEQDTSSIYLNSISSIKVKKNIIIVNKYNDVFPKLHDIKEKHNINEDLSELPYCGVLLGMATKGKLFQYFTLRNDFSSKLEGIVIELMGLKNNQCCIRGAAETNRRFLHRLKINIAGGQQ